MLWLESIILTKLIHKKMIIYNTISMPGKLGHKEEAAIL